MKELARVRREQPRHQRWSHQLRRSRPLPWIRRRKKWRRRTSYLLSAKLSSVSASTAFVTDHWTRKCECDYKPVNNYCRSLYFRVMKFSRKLELALFREMMNSRPEPLANLWFFSQTRSGVNSDSCRFRLKTDYILLSIPITHIHVLVIYIFA